LFAALCVCVCEILSLPWFSKELKNDVHHGNYNPSRKAKSNNQPYPSFIHFSSDSLLLIFESFTAHHLSKNNWLRGIIFILLVRESIFVGWGFPFLIVLVWYKLSLCYNRIKPDLLGFLGIGVFACGLLDRVFKSFASNMLTMPFTSQLAFFWFFRNWNQQIKVSSLRSAIQI